MPKPAAKTKVMNLLHALSFNIEEAFVPIQFLLLSGIEALA